MFLPLCLRALCSAQEAGREADLPLDHCAKSRLPPKVGPHAGADSAPDCLQVLNVLLNMEQGHREALQAARKPASKLAGYLRWQQEKLSGHAIFKGHRRLR